MALGTAFTLRNYTQGRNESDLILEKISGTASSTTAYVYGAGVDTPTHALTTGSYQLKHVKTIDSAMVIQTSTADATCVVKSSEETQDDLLTITTGSGDTFDCWVLGWTHEAAA